MNIEEANRELKRISEKDYTARIAHALGRDEEQDAGNHLPPGGALAIGGVLERSMDTIGILRPVTTPIELVNRFSLIDDEQLSKLVREAVHRALYPTAEMANPHEHRRIEMTEQDGKKWRGVLYAVDQNEG